MNDLSGQCHCGQCKVEFTGEPEFQFICYCRSCSTLNGGGHLCGIMIDESHFSPATNTSCYQYTGGSGSAIEMHFCPTCATTLYGYPRAYPNKVVLRANTIKGFDFKPQQNLFAEEAFSWDKPS